MKKRLFILLIIFCFCILPNNCFAKEVGDIYPPNSLEIYNFGDDDTGYPSTSINNLQNSSFSQTAFYTYKFSSVQDRVSLRFNYLNTPLQPNKSYTFNFIIYSEFFSKLSEPYRVVVKDLNGHITSCDIKSSSTAFYESSNLNKVTSHYNPVVCNNVYMTSSSFHVYVFDSFSSVNTVGISRIGYSSSDEQTITGALADNTDAINNQSKQQHEDAQKQLEEQKKQNETIKDSDTSDASNEANSFFGDFEDDDYGLSDVITIPLEFIKGLSSSQCNSLNLPLPFVDTNLTLPCMTSIYSQYFGSFLTLYQVITTGFIAYWVCLNIFRMVQGFKNPDNDEVEVMEL